MKILVPTDGSELSKLALKKAVEISKKNEDEIHLITVISSTFGFSMDIPQAFYDKFVNEMETIARKMLDGLIDSVKDSGANIKTYIATAISVADSIVDYAETQGIDLIIMGSHGADKANFLLGSIASKVVQNAKCSVYVVKK